MIKDCYTDLMKTWSINGSAFLASVATSLETILQLTLLALSIAYTIKKLREKPDDPNPKP